MQNITLERRPDYKLADKLITAYAKLGVFINAPKLLKHLEENTTETRYQEQKVFDLIGKHLNLNSPQQLLSYLLYDLDLSENDLKYKGKVTTGVEVLKRVAEKYDIQILREIVTYKQLTSSSKSLKEIANFARYTDLKDNFGNQLAVCFPLFERRVTSRYYSNSPNIQGLANIYRELICAPKGYKIMSLDVKQQEPIIFFFGMLRNPVMMDIISKNPKDVYLALTSAALTRKYMIEQIKHKLETYSFRNQVNSISPDSNLFRYLVTKGDGNLELNNDGTPIIDDGVIFNNLAKNLIPMEKVKPHERDMYKIGILSGGYGASESSLIETTNRDVGSNWYRLLNTIPEYVTYKQYAENYLRRGGDIVLSLFGTPRKINKSKSINANLRVMINSPVQGSGADMQAFAFEDLYKWTLAKNYTHKDVRLLFPRHDEHLIMFREEIEDEMEEVKGLYELQVEDWLPIRVSKSINYYYEDK